jgi:ABC-type branched-subunit amino acid transport system substrate-binding protein
VTRAAPIVVGLLADRPGREGALVAEVRRVVAEAVEAGRIDRPVQFESEVAEGLPTGTAAAVAEAFGRLVARRPLLVLGPTITDNGLVVRDLADAARIPCCNWTGSEETRSEWMFQYQIGSLEEEPHLLAAHLCSLGHRRVVVVQDRSPIGRRYGSFFERAADREGLEVVGRTLVSPVADDLGPHAERLGAVGADALCYLGLGLAAGALGRALDGTTHPPVFANSALMFGYAFPEWTAHWEGWTYVDAWTEDNPRLAGLLAGRGDAAGLPFQVAAGDDLGRLVVEALAGADVLTPAGVKDALQRVKWLPASLGRPGTTMGFGVHERGALKGGFILLRRWSGGRSVAVR